MKPFKAGCLALGLWCLMGGANAAQPYDAIVADQQAGKYDSALARIDQVLVRDQNDMQALLLKGNVNKLMGNTEQAINIFKQLISLYPEMPEAYNNLAVVYADRGETALAIETLQQVFATSNSYSTAYQNLRELYNQMASSAYREALDMDDGKTPVKSSQFALLNKPFHEGTLTQSTATASTENQAVTPPPSAPAQAAGTDDADSQINLMIGRWSQAWSQRKVQDYIAFYHSGFAPANGTGRKEWERTRRIRLNKPKYIEIDIVGLSVKAKTANTAMVIFEQHYRSDTYQDTVVKQLELKKQNNQWKIFRENVL